MSPYCLSHSCQLHFHTGFPCLFQRSQIRHQGFRLGSLLLGSGHCACYLPSSRSTGSLQPQVCLPHVCHVSQAGTWLLARPRHTRTVLGRISSLLTILPHHQWHSFFSLVVSGFYPPGAAVPMNLPAWFTTSMCFYRKVVLD